MTVHRVRLLGDPILRMRSEPVTDPRSPAARLVATDLEETLADLQARHSMGRAIAAPQIGAPMRMLYVDTDDLGLMVNPEIIDVGTDDFFVWDGCFSFPDLLVRVVRAYHIKVRYQDHRGTEHAVEASEALAELLQHEIDHLDGVLAVDRATGLDPFCIREEWNKHYADGGAYSEIWPRNEPVGSLTL